MCGNARCVGGLFQMWNICILSATQTAMGVGRRNGRSFGILRKTRRHDGGTAVRREDVMRYGLAYKDVADWQVEWKHTNADLTALLRLLREFVEHFESNFEDPGLEL